MAHACPDRWLTPHRTGGSAAPEYSMYCKDGAFNANRDVVLMAVGNNRDDFSNKELFDYGMKLLNITVKDEE